MGCDAEPSPTLAPNVTSQQQSGASASMGLSFPPETKFLLYYRSSETPGFLPAPDDSVFLKIELPAPALRKFLEQAPLSSAKWSGVGSHIYDIPKWPDWQPSKVKKFRSEQFGLPNAQALNVLIDDDREDTKIVYLQWFET